MAEEETYTDPSEVEDETPGLVEDGPVEDTTTIRAVGLFNESFTYNGITITRTGTAVPADQVNEILEAAHRSKIQLEVTHA